MPHTLATTTLLRQPATPLLTLSRPLRRTLLLLPSYPCLTGLGACRPSVKFRELKQNARNSVIAPDTDRARLERGLNLSTIGKSKRIDEWIQGGIIDVAIVMSSPGTATDATPLIKY